VRLRKRLLAGESFEELLKRSIDEHTRNLGGALGWLSRGQPVRGLGANEEFIEAVMSVPAGQISQPIRTSKGYHLVKVEIHEAARMRTLESVSEAIRRRLLPEKYNALTGHFLDSLRSVHKVEVNEKALLGDEALRERKAKELFQQAQNADGAAERLRIYKEIASEYADSKYGAQAQFMIGFIHAEELKDKESARAALEDVIKRYPDSELVDSARWMLENMDSTLAGAGSDSVGARSPRPSPMDSGRAPHGTEGRASTRPAPQPGGDGSD
jgi:parvulin-like peptidyl-prolyl isomerase